MHDEPFDQAGDDDARADESHSDEASSEAASNDASGEASESMVDTRGVDWAQVMPDYVEGDWSLKRIAAKHGTSDATLRKRAKQYGWVRLVGTKPLPAGRSSRPPGAAPPKPEDTRRKRMLKRLFQVLDAKMSELEARMTPGVGQGIAMGNDGMSAPQSAADTERDARSLNALARLYAKLVELDDAASGGAPENLAKDGDDADRLRRDLADRLARLSSTGDA